MNQILSEAKSHICDCDYAPGTFGLVYLTSGSGCVCTCLDMAVTRPFDDLA